MLILSRKDNESIIINGNIEVKIISSENGRVRIGIDAPQNVEIHRKEVFDQIMSENRSAAQSAGGLSMLKDKIGKKNPKKD